MTARGADALAATDHPDDGAPRDTFVGGRDEPLPVWLLAPVGRDARLLRQGLSACARDVRIADDVVALRRAFAATDEVGVLVLTQEALSGDILQVVQDHLAMQPPWSELPILLLVDSTGNTARELGRFQAALPRSRILVLQRPVRVSELESAVSTMARSRRRQLVVRDHVVRQEALRRELNHRVKNILATVQALHALTASGAEDLDTFNDIFEGRLETMANVHQVFYDADYAASDLGTVIDAVVRTYREAGRLRVDGVPITVGPEIAQDLALSVHELVTNAVKYGALSAGSGQVRMSWRREGEAFALDWVERDGPAVSAPSDDGYGTRFIGMTMRGRGGSARFDYRPEGVRVALVAPLHALEERAS